MRIGAFRGPRLLTCGRIVSATSPGGRFFEGMYREADGEDDVRRAVREQLRHGADFVKLMTTGARSVELEDPDPAQMTRAEIATAVEEAHRLGYRVAAHAEGLAGTELAIEEGVDTIEHGMYLNQRPDLLERMAETGQVLVPTLSCFYGVAEQDALEPAAGRAGEVQPRAGRQHAEGGARGRRADRARPRLEPVLRQRDRARADGPPRPDRAPRRSSRRPRPPRRRSASATSSAPSSPAGSPTCSSSTATRCPIPACCGGASGSGSSCSSASPSPAPRSKRPRSRSPPCDARTRPTTPPTGASSA